MPWIPNWDLNRTEISIDSDDMDFDSFHKVEVVKEGEHLYRLYDVPYCDGLRWGDLIRVIEHEDSIEFVEIVERAEHTFTHGQGVTNKRHAGLILDAIMKAGGFWADDGIFGFDLAIPPGFDVEKWEEDNREAIEANTREDTSYDKWMHFRSDKHLRMMERKKLLHEKWLSAMDESRQEDHVNSDSLDVANFFSALNNLGKKND